MLVICWFENNYVILNKDKGYLIVLDYKHEQAWANINKDLICKSDDVKLLGITIYKDLNFDKHAMKVCSKTNQKLSAPSRMTKSLSVNKRSTLFKAFSRSQFNYFSIVCMFHKRGTNNKINRIHERALRIDYHGGVSMFDRLLVKGNLSVFTIKKSKDS